MKNAFQINKLRFIYHCADLEKAQALLQDTCGAGDISSDDDESTVTTPRVTPMCVCSGQGGCGEEHPANEMGADFSLAKLCKYCYS